MLSTRRLSLYAIFILVLTSPEVHLNTNEMKACVSNHIPQCIQITTPVTSEFPHKGQWHGALMFSAICAWTNGGVNNRATGDLRRHRTHYDVIVMIIYKLLALDVAVIRMRVSWHFEWYHIQSVIQKSICPHYDMIRSYWMALGMKDIDLSWRISTT